MKERYVLLNPATLCYHSGPCSRLILVGRGRKSAPLEELTEAELPAGAWHCSYCYSKAGRRRGDFVREASS